MNKPLLRVENLSLQMDNKLILDNINFSINEGEIITVIGPNGSGKTSLIKCILGLIKTKKDEIQIADEAVIGYMPQMLSMNQNLPITVIDFLRLSIGKPIDEKIIERVVEFVSIKKLLNNPMQKLSGGEKQFVLLAKSLIKQPNLLILDEPTQGIDVKRQGDFYRLIDELRKTNNIACLIVSHDLHMVMKTTDYVICLNHHICCQGPVTKIDESEEFQNLFDHDSLHSFSLYKHHHDHTH